MYSILCIGLRSDMPLINEETILEFIYGTHIP